MPGGGKQVTNTGTNSNVSKLKYIHFDLFHSDVLNRLFREVATEATAMVATPTPTPAGPGTTTPAVATASTTGTT